jgi:hypothetical protein
MTTCLATTMSQFNPQWGYIFIYICMKIYVYICIHICIHTCVYVYAYVYMPVCCIYEFICSYIHMYTYIYLYVLILESPFTKGVKVTAISNVQVLCQGLSSILNWFLYKVRYRSLVSVSYIWILVSPKPFYWKSNFFSVICFWHFCGIYMVLIVLTCFLVFYFIRLCLCFFQHQAIFIFMVLYRKIPIDIFICNNFLNRIIAYED